MFRVDIGLYIRIMLWALLHSLVSDPCPVGFAVVLTVDHVSFFILST